MQKDLYNTIIKKPWGEEYCVYRNSNLSIWLLKINPDHKTSLHCHPNKKTGLILLGGTASISLIERTFKIEGFKKLIFRSGMFHQTYNDSNEPIYLIEVETPDDKFDLIRIEDQYGRKRQQFENESQWQTIEKKPFSISDSDQTSFKNFYFSVDSLNNIKKYNLKDDDIIILIENNAFTSESNKILCECGEVLTYKIYKFLNNHFKENLNAKAIFICQK